MINLRRNWITPLTTGSFLLSAVTGALIFFHLDTGANKFIHEWLSWAFVCGALFHVTVNFKVLKQHVVARQGVVIIGIFAVILVASFVPSNRKPPFAAPIRALSQVPLSTLSQVAQISSDDLIARLAQAGVRPASEHQRLCDLVGNDTRRQMHILHAVFDETAK